MVREKSRNKVERDAANRASPGRSSRSSGGHFVSGHDIGKDTRFRPGRSGNPSGRPRKTDLDYAIEEYLSSEVVTRTDKHGRSERKAVARILAEALIRQALAGKRGIAKLIFERVGGKPRRPVQFIGTPETNRLTPAQRRARIGELLKKTGG
jgi:hypothetical protein